MPSAIPTLQPGSVTLQSVTAADLGNLYIGTGGKIFRVVKAGAAIAAPANKVIVTALSSGVPTWVVNTSTTANDWLAVGIIPADYTATIAIDSYFMVQVAGPCKGISAAAIANGGLIGTSTTAGKIDDATVTAGVGAIGVALEAAGAGDETPDVLLKGLL